MSDTNQTPATIAVVPNRKEHGPARRKRILLAEGDGFTRLVLLFRLRLAGFGVDFTSNGILALGKLRSCHPDILLVELKLVGLSGLELIQAARQNPEFGTRPIYVFTHAEAMSRATRKEVQMLATKVFDKGTVTREDLVTTLSALLVKPVPDGEQSPAIAAAEPEAEPLPETVLPGELEEIIEGVRRQSKLLAQSRDAIARAETGCELLSRVRSLSSCAEAAGLPNLGRQTKVLEEFLAQLSKGGQPCPDSALRAVTRAVELMGALSRECAAKGQSLREFSAVVVDEDPCSGKAITEALSHAGFKPACFAESAPAKSHLASNSADLIIANVVLPEAHGLALSDLRQLPLHPTTPVIFVAESSALPRSSEELPTSAPRANTNPLLLKELIVKALNEAQGVGMPVITAPALGFKGAKAIAPNAAASLPADSGCASSPKAAREKESLLFQASLDEPMFTVDPSTFSGPVPAIASLKPASQVANKMAQAERGQATVLFVEDDPFVLRVYRKCLKREGFHVEVAEDGLAAIEVLPRIRPDVVVLDLMLPKLNGLEVLKFIRSDGDLHATPVLVLSNAYLEGLATKANQAGANRGLLKTECTPAKLVQALRDLLGSPGVRPSPGPAPHEPEVQAPHDDPGSAAETAIWTRQADLHKDAPEEITKIRHACRNYIKATGAEERLENLTELYRRVRFLSARAGLSGLTKIAELCSALEGLLFQIVFKQSESTASTFQTIAQAVDCLDRLSLNRDTTFLEPRTKARVLVVDDDPVCNLAMVTALKRSGFDTTGLQDPLDSLGALNSGAFDLIVLDINMPKMTGFEVCEYLRRIPRYKSVPVMFIATDGEFQNRSRSVVSGGNDLMAKPICALELIVKATMHLLNSPSQGLSESVDASDQPLAWSLEPTVEDKVIEAAPGPHATTTSNVCAPGDVLLTDSEIPCELFRRAEPDAAATDGQAEIFSGSPEDEVAPLQTDDRRLETAQSSGLLPDATGLPKPEPATEDPTVAAEAQAEAESHELAALKPQVERELLAQTAQEAPQSFDSPGCQLDAVVPVAGDVDKAAREAEARCALLEGELAHLRQACDELNGRLAQEQQVNAESRARIKDLESQLQPGESEHDKQGTESVQVAGQSVTALARAVADLAMERGQRQRSEQRGATLSAQLQALHEEFSRALQAQQASLEQIGTLEDQLRQREEALAHRDTDFEQQQSEHQLAEEQLQKAKDLNSQLRKHIALSDGANRTFERTRQELQSKLETALGALRESEASAQKEASERQRLKEALDSAQLSHQERTQQGDLEHSKLQTALQLEQLERARQETELARMRHESLDAAHGVRALGNNLRRQIREPVENLCQSARSLLELEMSEQQRKLAEAVLQDALTVHTRLQEAGATQPDSNNGSAVAGEGGRPAPGLTQQRDFRGGGGVDFTSK